MTELLIRNLCAQVGGKQILNGVNLRVKSGEVHALMGPNGSGKTTLSNVIMGHPKYKVTSGDVMLDGESILGLSPDKRAKKGLFLAFQYPVEVPGVSIANFLRTSFNAVHSGNSDKTVRGEMTNIIKFQEFLEKKMSLVGVTKDFSQRYLNDGFSGGEKKKAEILQMAVLEPKIAVLDETDSGLDVDALKTVANGVKKLSGPNLGVLIITHYNRILHYVKPDFVHVMIGGKIVKSGGFDLAQELEERGYEWLKPSPGITVGKQRENIGGLK